MSRAVFGGQPACASPPYSTSVTERGIYHKRLVEDVLADYAD